MFSFYYGNFLQMFKDKANDYILEMLKSANILPGREINLNNHLFAFISSFFRGKFEKSLPSFIE